MPAGGLMARCWRTLPQRDLTPPTVEQHGVANLPSVTSHAERASSFGSIANEYDRARPGPPKAAVDWLLPGRAETVVDLGAGTGLLSRALARALNKTTAQVVAVEPDARMRAVLADRSPGIRVLAGTGEHIPLPEASVDGVFVSSAWHWMDPDLAIPEIARVLRDGARFGVMWTMRDHEVEWLRELGRPAATGRATEGDSARGTRHEIRLPTGGVFGHIVSGSFRFTLTMSIDSFVDLHGTYSRVITAAPDERSAELAGIRDTLHGLFPDTEQIDVPMRCRCWRADRTPRALPASA
jgi:SAM-dependent methyltransferase